MTEINTTTTVMNSNTTVYYGISYTHYARVSHSRQWCYYNIARELTRGRSQGFVVVGELLQWSHREAFEI